MRPFLFGWVLLLVGYDVFLAHPPPWGWRRTVAFVLWLVLWANLHASVAIVPVLCALAFTEILLRVVLRREGWRAQRGPVGHWALLGLLSGAALLVQPAGWRIVPYVLRTEALNNQASHEWLPLLRFDVWRDKPFLALFFLLLVGLTALAARARHRRGVAGTALPLSLPALATLAFALGTRRMVFLSFLAIDLVLTEAHLWLLSRSAGTRRGGAIFSPRASWIAGVGAMLLILGWSFERRPGPTRAGPFARGLVPEGAITFLRETHLEGRMVNDEYWGGMLAYFLYPEVRTFLDGRWLMVGEQVLVDHFRIRRHEPTMEALCDRYGIDFLVQSAAEWARMPPPDAGRWVLAYQDLQAVVALRRTERFEANLRRACAFYRRHRRGAEVGSRVATDGPPLPRLPECCCEPEVSARGSAKSSDQ
jgi:hypothetical protein